MTFTLKAHRNLKESAWIISSLRFLLQYIRRQLQCERKKITL